MKVTMGLQIVGLVLVSSLIYQPVHSSASGSCAASCDVPFNLAHPCSCNSVCITYQDCCADYAQYCVLDSCTGRCGNSFDPSKPCSCNTACVQHGDCCTDYQNICNSGSDSGSDSGVIPSTDLQSAVQNTWVADAALRLTPGQDFTLNLQTRVSQSNTQDSASSPLFQSISSTKLGSDIFQTFDSLLDNYLAQTGIRESTSTTEYREVTDFLTAVYATPTFQTMKAYLQSKGLLPQTDTGVDLRMRELWFLPYSRASGVDDSSGFEHVFLGEFKGGVSGMHNWYRMHKLEQSGELNYQGYTGTQQPQLVSAQIVWSGSRKSGASMFVGTTPAFDLSVYTLCFLEKTNQICQFNLEGSSIRIQTYDMTSEGSGTTVGTAFPKV